MLETAQSRQQEIEHAKPVKIAHIPLSLKAESLDEKTSVLMARLMRKNAQAQGGNTAWAKLSRQKTNYKKAEAANVAAAAKKTACANVAAKWGAAAAAKKAGAARKPGVRPPGFGHDLPKTKIVSTEEQLQELQTRTEAQLNALNGDVAKNHTTLVQSTDKLLESHSQLLARIAKLEEANAAVLAGLEQLLQVPAPINVSAAGGNGGINCRVGVSADASRRRRRQVLPRAGSASKVETVAAASAGGAFVATAALTPALDHMSAGELTTASLASAAEHRAEVREEGAQPGSRSTPFEA